MIPFAFSHPQIDRPQINIPNDVSFVGVQINPMNASRRKSYWSHFCPSRLKKVMTFSQRRARLCVTDSVTCLCHAVAVWSEVRKLVQALEPRYRASRPNVRWYPTPIAD